MATHRKSENTFSRESAANAELTRVICYLVLFYFAITVPIIVLTGSWPGSGSWPASK